MAQPGTAVAIGAFMATGRRERVPGYDHRTEICVLAPKIPLSLILGAGVASAVGEFEMIADPKRKLHQDSGNQDSGNQDSGNSEKRRRQEEELDEALKNTFPASDPVSMEQP
jgi:hypothetical protein